VCEKLIYYCIKNDFQLLASEQTCFQHIDNANKLATCCLFGQREKDERGGEEGELTAATASGLG